MKNTYDLQKFRRALAYKLAAASIMLLGLSTVVSAQSTTINTHTMAATGYTGGTSTGSGGTKFITFAVHNASGSPIKLTDVGNWTATSHNGQTSTLFYSSTSLSGTVGTLPTSGWDTVSSQTVSGITSTTVNPVNTGMNFIIPNNTTYRFAILTTGTNYYSSSGTPNSFTVSGVSLYTGNYQISGSNVGYAATLSPRYFTGFITFEPAYTAPDNAGITTLISPLNFCAGNHPVQIEIVNSGTATLTSAVINWELDNIPQPAINWSGSLATGAKATVMLNNSVAFGSAARTVKAWTALPNGKTDTVNNDDTLNAVVRASLNGVYTVGTGGDFPTVVDAANTLNQFGVCGPVTMNILSGVYNGQIMLDDISGASAVNRITFQSQSGNPANVTIAASPATTGYVFQFNNASYVTLKNVTVQSNATNAGRVVEFTGTSSYDSVVNCKINSSVFSSSSNAAGIYATDLAGSNNVLLNNDIVGGYYGIYWRGTSTSNITENHVLEGNDISDVYYYSMYLYYTGNLKIRNNTVRAINSPTTHYGIYGYYNDGALEVVNNDFIITGNGQKSGIYMLYSDASATARGITLNNTIAIDCGTSTAYGLYSSYGSYNDFVNNSVSVNSTSTDALAARFYYNTTSTGNHNIVNNAFSNVTGDGYTMFVYNPTTSYNNYWDYNNLHSGNGKVVEVGTPAATHTSLSAWSAASGYDKHSISYDPGFRSSTDLRPDPNNPASWSLNGRALHIPDNNIDKAGNPRITLRPDGVPDIGAYEFEPESTPPLATAAPDSASPGDVQVFTFGDQKVATVKWGMAGLTVPLEVRQYSGEKAPGIAAAASPSGSMYFHTGVNPVGGSSTFDFELTLDYMEIWLGDIPNDNNLKLAHKVTSYPWMVYTGALSSVNTANDEVAAPAMNRFGTFTALEDGSIQSAFVRAQGKTIICIGNSVVLNAEPQDGDYYKWYHNGTAIPGAEGANTKTYSATQAGAYSVAITSGGKTVESVPLFITTISAPNALISANGPLTYCTGNGLTLDAGTAQGVTYQWQLDGVNIPGAVSNTYAVNQAGNYTVVVENIGCASTSVPTPVQSGPLDVNIGNDTSYCEVPNVWATLDAGYPGATYRWSTGDTARVIEVKQSGNYWVEVNGGPNCIDADTIKVTIDQLPSANGISFVQNGNTYQFYPSGPIGATGFLWIFSDGTTSNQANPTKTITGDVYVRLVLFNQCGTDTVQLGWPLTVSNTFDEDAIVVFPNPATHQITIRTSAAIEELTIINSMGAIVNRLDATGKQEYTINVANLPAGNYMLRARAADGVINRQFSIVR